MATESTDAVSESSEVPEEFYTAGKDTESTRKHTTPVYPLNKTEKVVVKAVHPIGCTALIGLLGGTLGIFILMRLVIDSYHMQ